jgi:hypothetical protein
MAEKILIKTPITTNGRDVVIGADGRVKYKEAIAPAGTRKGIERINKLLPDALKHKIEEYTDGDGTVTADRDLPPDAIKKTKK